MSHTQVEFLAWFGEAKPIAYSGFAIGYRHPALSINAMTVPLNENVEESCGAAGQRCRAVR
ncbi:hypothetical protein [Aporhodopirellula aestuarii]|uniref:Uncharacterized protein n=1 Tax=Aporhodopirellula aestuarii TaxID=2950107 RepID=A0ABT0U7K6_9BACT|nr:hypothetical protein [Aporhodopirellula aestuarii]MCM2372535.1 hypothetical protein [Aporhodopirellula aestuarii]